MRELNKRRLIQIIKIMLKVYENHTEIIGLCNLSRRCCQLGLITFLERQVVDSLILELFGGQAHIMTFVYAQYYLNDLEVKPQQAKYKLHQRTHRTNILIDLLCYVQATKKITLNV